MTNRIFCILGICCLMILSVSSQTKNKFPSFIKICKRNSEAFKCVMENIERCKPYLGKGIPKLAVPPLNPFIVPSLDILGNNLQLRLKNLKAHNLANLEIRDGSLEFEKFKLSLDLYLPYIYNEFEYEANGRILVLNFNGKGTGNINASDVSIHIDANGHQVERQGKTWLAVDDVIVDYRSKNGHIQLDNLFNNQAELNEHTNRLINENFNEFENEVAPDIAKSISVLMKGIASNVLGKFTLDELFPLE